MKYYTYGRDFPQSFYVKTFFFPNKCSNANGIFLLFYWRGRTLNTDTRLISVSIGCARSHRLARPPTNEVSCAFFIHILFKHNVYSTQYYHIFTGPACIQARTLRKPNVMWMWLMFECRPLQSTLNILYFIMYINLNDGEWYNIYISLLVEVYLLFRPFNLSSLPNRHGGHSVYHLIGTLCFE